MQQALQVTTREILVGTFGNAPALHTFKTVDITKIKLTCAHEGCRERDHAGEHTLTFMFMNEELSKNLEAGIVQELGIDPELPECGPLTLVLDTSGSKIDFMAVLKDDMMAALLRS